MKPIRTDKAPAPIGPYNQAVLAEGKLYLSGQVAIDPATGALHPSVTNGSVGEEAKVVMDNLGAVLEAAGMTHHNLVKCSIFLKDLNDFDAVNEVYGTYFKEGFAPARECVQVVRLPKDVRVEISGIAFGRTPDY
jgi:2-iminobutanoate/2-iminopropanoate deaminase